MIVAYRFDLRTNQLETTKVPNPNAGREHVFKVYRADGDPADRVSLRDFNPVLEERVPVDNEEDGGNGNRIDD